MPVVCSVKVLLKSQPGVVSAQVNLASQNATVSYDPSQIQPEALRKSVQAIGYDLWLSLPRRSEELEIQQKKAYRKLKVRTIGALLLAAPVAFLGMRYHHPAPWQKFLEMISDWHLVVFGFGWPFFKRAFQQAKHGRANMDTLVAVSTGTAFFSALSILYILLFLKAEGWKPRYISRLLL